MKMRDLFLLVAILMMVIASGCCPAGSRPAAVSLLDGVGGEFVEVEWLGRNTYWVARIVDHQEELTGVRYADGSREWVVDDRIRPLTIVQGSRVNVRWSRDHGRSWNGEVLNVRDGLIEVRFDEGRGETWVSLGMVTRLLEESQDQEQAAPPPPPQPEAVQQQQQQVPTPAPVDPSRLAVGRIVVATYSNSRYGAEILALAQERVRIRWLQGNSEEWITLNTIVRVYDQPPTELETGDRVRYYAGSDLALGFVNELRGDFVRVGPSGSARGDWVERAHVVQQISAPEPGQIIPGQHVGVMWNSQIWGAIIVEVQGGGVRIRWDNGGSIQLVPVGDVIELW